MRFDLVMFDMLLVLAVDIVDVLHGFSVNKGVKPPLYPFGQLHVVGQTIYNIESMFQPNKRKDWYL